MKGSPNYGYVDSPHWKDRMVTGVAIDDWENDESFLPWENALKTKYLKNKETKESSNEKGLSKSIF